MNADLKKFAQATTFAGYKSDSFRVFIRAD